MSKPYIRRKMPRERITKHVYKTPSGRFYDDRKGRITSRDAAKAVKNRVAMERKFRDGRGRVRLRSYRVTYTRRRRSNPHARTDELETFSEEKAPVFGYDHDPDPEEVRKDLDRLDRTYVSFDVSSESLDEGEDAGD